MSGMTVFWIIVIVAAAVVELATNVLVSIWFVAGGAAAMLLELLGCSVSVQWVAFGAVSLLVLFLFRGKVAKKLREHRVATNADSVIGRVYPVKEAINNEKACGLLSVGDQEWAARSEDGSIIEAGVHVKVLRIEGVKLIVEPAEEI